MRIWSNYPLPDAVRKIVRRHRGEILSTLRKCKMETGCQKASWLWMQAFTKYGVEGALVEGTFNDTRTDEDNFIGHSWLELYLDGTLIFDSTADQFDTKPNEDKYTEHFRVEF